MRQRGGIRGALRAVPLAWLLALGGGCSESSTPIQPLPPDPLSPVPDSGSPEPIPDGGAGEPDAGDPGPLQRPYVSGTAPAANAVNVPRDTAVAADVVRPNLNGGVDGNTLTDNTVKLTRVADGVKVPGTVNTSGGADAIVFQPTEILNAETTYQFEVTDAVKDLRGQPFVPFSGRFTTSKGLAVKTNPCVTFQPPVVVFDGTSSTQYAPEAKANLTLAFGPDGRLYAAGLDGILRRWDVDPVGNLSNLREYAGFAGRSVVGLAFDRSRLGTLWVSHNAPVYVQPAPAFSGKISRLTVDLDNGAAFNAVPEDYVVNLPRSTRDHLSNSLAFGPDGLLYMTQGSNTAMGAPDRGWSFRPEHLLTAAVLQIDPALTTGLPIDVQTENEDNSPIPGAYDPYASGAPVRIFATGVRNAYDLLWHSNGHLYVPTNGSAAGGNLPALPPLVPEVIRGGPTQDDFLFDVVAGGYYGHPNPRRAEYVLNGGNPTADADFAEVVTVGSNPGYPVGVQPAARYDRSRIAWNFGRNRSPNGIIEYTNATFGGRLSGSMLVMEYSGGDDILSFKLDPQGRVLPQSVVAVVRGLTDPLDLVEHQPTGALFVTDLSDEGRKGGRVLLLRPAPSTDPACQ